MVAGLPHEQKSIAQRIRLNNHKACGINMIRPETRCFIKLCHTKWLTPRNLPVKQYNSIRMSNRKLQND